MNNSDFIYNEGLDGGYSHIGALPFNDIENETIKYLDFAVYVHFITKSHRK